MAEFDVVERIPRVGPDLTVIRIQFSPPGDSRIHSNLFQMQLYPISQEMVVDGLGRRITESGILVPPIIQGEFAGLFPEEPPVDRYLRQSVNRNNDSEMVANIEAYLIRKALAEDLGQPYPQQHNSTLNLQVGASSDDADELKSGGLMDIDDVQLRYGSLGVGRHCGIRFTGVSGLSGATIDAATLTFRAAVTDSASFVGDWYAEDAAAPPTFTTTESDISNRARTATTCEGDGADFGSWTANSDATFTGPSPSIKGIIQALADSYDPSTIVLIHLHISGNGERVAKTYDDTTTTAPKLDIDSTPPSAGQPTQHRTQGIPTGSGYRDRPGRWN